MAHFTEGFIGLFTGHLNAFENFLEFETTTFTLKEDKQFQTYEHPPFLLSIFSICDSVGICFVLEPTLFINQINLTKKNNALASGNAGDKKNLHPGDCKKINYQFN